MLLAAVGCGPADAAVPPVAEPEGWRPWETAIVDGEREDSPGEGEENGCTRTRAEPDLLRCSGTGFRHERLSVRDGAHRPGKRPGALRDFGHRNGLVFTTTEDYSAEPRRHVRALDEETRAQRWAQPVDSAPVLTRDGIVGDEPTKLRWPPGTDPDEGESPPSADPGGDIIGWDPDTGEERWRIGTADDEYCAPTAAAGRTFVTCTGDEAAGTATWYRVDPEEAAMHRIAEVDLGGLGAEYLGYDGGDLVFLPDASDEEGYHEEEYEELVRVDARTGGERRVALPANVRDGAQADLAAGDVYFRQRGNEVLVADARSGAQRWLARGPYEQPSAPDVSTRRNEVYFADGQGRLVALDRRTGSERWRTGARARDGGTDTGEMEAPSSVRRAGDVLVVSAGNTVFSVSPEDPDAAPDKRTTASPRAG
ncbi:putative pyrroloquinoline-quinone binding quinoprotein [Murinocardiopsis flavida]|uniref:Putative pyrroloquinoline-quinone binding quinoprotein n=1 Tax=Murinocardiopsis flavida TaxID=645275 RepID=A0A2P8CSY9_9ACTN|nr:PQQ-binding-like beta-propeller repeat protein [Murinocardiopsis flavida]PSK88083.1 putative pyrroloquinoline-quinone binding quinoprotein [Murinocardiopsis flavida]